MFQYLCCEACKILSLQPVTEPTPTALGGEVLSTGPPNDSVFILNPGLLILPKTCNDKIKMIAWYIFSCLSCIRHCPKIFTWNKLIKCLFKKIFYFYFILLYNTVLVLPYIDMNQPRVYMSSPSWTPLPPPTPYHLSGSSPCTSRKHPVSCIEPRLVLPHLMSCDNWPSFCPCL